MTALVKATAAVREALARAICEADDHTLDYERRLPDPPFTVDEDGLRHYSDGETWECYLSHADAVLAAFKVSPIEQAPGIEVREHRPPRTDFAIGA